MQVFWAILSGVLLAASDGDWTVATMDGQNIQGKIGSFSPTALELTTPAGSTVSIRANQLKTLTPLVAPAPSLTKPAVWVELLDRTRLAALTFETKGQFAQVELLNGEKLEIPLAELATVQFSEEFNPDLRAKQAEAAGDQIGVKKKASVDYLEGVLGDVTRDAVNFKLDGDNIPVNRNKIANLIYVAKNPREFDAPFGLLIDSMGAEYAVARLTLTPAKFQVTTLAGITVGVPRDTVRKWDFSGGKQQYLSELTHESIAVTPNPLLYKADVPNLALYFAPRFDRGHFGEKFLLEGQEYAKGIGLSTKTELIYKLPPGYKRLQGLVGLDDEVGDEGEVLFVILADGKELLRQVVRGADKPLGVDVSIANVRKLTLIADYGEGAPLALDLGDKLNFVDARLIK
ncbi:MAG: NPCBM/NEW2 domain-containing protein [Pirellulales bacterium]|nr:NPCBM/NEW2 domain-containing protein [Pirellulales bacterium]